MIRVSRFAATAALTLLAACASAPTQFLTLLPPPGEAHERGAPAGPAVVVSIPGQDDQPQLVVRRSDGSLTVMESERWIAPLGEEMQAALVLSLSPRWAALPPAHVRVDVQRFDSVPGDYAFIEAAWSVTLDAPPKRSASCRSAIRIAVGGGYPALAAGHRAALEQLAADILAQAANLRDGGDPAHSHGVSGA